jgi:hypothetical protein
VPGDTCTNPLVVPVGGGAPVTLSIDQAAYFDSTSFSCGGGGFNDVHLNFRPLEVGLLRVTAQRADGGRPPLLSRQCQSNGFACIPADGGQVGLTLRIDDPTTGDTALSLDEVGPEGVVTVTASLQTPAPGDWCSGAVPLPLDDAGTATVSGDTRGFEDEPFAPYCGWRGPDAFYSIAARPYARLVQATVIPTGLSARARRAGHQPKLHFSVGGLHGAAARGAERLCPVQPAGQHPGPRQHRQPHARCGRGLHAPGDGDSSLSARRPAFSAFTLEWSVP